MTISLEPTRRFSNRVSDYVKYRPQYPAAVIDRIASRCGIQPNSLLFDVGSGTGIMSKQLLETGGRVIGVEPNELMRHAAEQELGGTDQFVSVNGTAEATTLPAGSADVVVAAQAFHWFDHAAFRAECQRILKPTGWVALVWNDRLTDASPFLIAYEQLLQQHGTDYKAVNHRNVDQSVLADFFGHAGFLVESFPNEQRFDWEGLLGRVRSSSYTPAMDDPRFPKMEAALRSLFDHNATDGKVIFACQTQLFVGEIK